MLSSNCPLTIARMFGSHLSIAGGMVNALTEAKRLNMDCVQVFTKNQRQWKAPPLKDSDRNEWLKILGEFGWDSIESSSPPCVVSHNSYLINLASPDPDGRKKSIAAQRDEVERCEALHIPLCVAHPGAHLSGTRPRCESNKLDGKPTKDELAGLKRIVKALDTIHRELPGYRVITCLETTVGSGTNLGYDFHHLAFIRENVKQPERVGFCFDTCHVTAAGYDLTTNENARKILAQWEDICGIDNLRVFHMNDSCTEVGSRSDRHAHIGDGHCGKSCFQAVVNHPASASVPKILETPKEKYTKGTEWDIVNLKRLKRMMRKAPASR